MLVLSRRASEKLFLTRGDETIEITVVRIGPTSVRFGIEADRSWNIAREEVAEEPKTGEMKEQVNKHGIH